MSKKGPVTELYEAANRKLMAQEDDGDYWTIGGRLGRSLNGLDMDALNGGRKPNTPLLEVLDLVAALPPGRRGLVRWVVGLGDEDLRALRGAITNGACEAKAASLDGDSERLREMVSTLHDALSGSEGPAKCPECHDTGKVKRVEGGGSVRVVKHDPCPKCAEGQSGAKEEAPACTSNGCKSCQYNGGCDQEDEQQPPHPMWGAVANAVVKPTPTIVAAGKPPPFLRVGMKLRRPDRAVVWVVLALTEEDFAQLGCGKCIMWIESRQLLTWPLAETFTVEGES